MRTSHRVAVGVVSALVAVLAGCQASATSSRAASIRVVAGRSEAIHAGSLSAAAVAADETTFGFALFHRLCASQPQSNVTLSPASAAEALGMLDAGAKGPTQAAVARLLRLPGWDSAVVAALHEQNTALGADRQVTISNHVFEQQGLTPTRQALDDLATAYGADLRQLNFADEPGATQAINDVVSHDTDGLVPTLFDQPLDPATQTVLTNAILLDAQWRAPFTSAASGPFHTAAGGVHSTAIMHNSEVTYAGRDSNGWQSVVLPYRGDQLQAVALLPPTRSSDGCLTPEPAELHTLTSGPSTSVEVALPKLDLTQTLPLTTTLAAMGLPTDGDYSGLGASDTAVSDVVQKVVMKVDQQGTKAAAATGVAIASSAVAPHQTVTFNRPFLFLVEDTATHTPLFLARVADPSGS